MIFLYPPTCEAIRGGSPRWWDHRMQDSNVRLHGSVAMTSYNKLRWQFLHQSASPALHFEGGQRYIWPRLDKIRDAESSRCSPRPGSWYCGLLPSLQYSPPSQGSNWQGNLYSSACQPQQTTRNPITMVHQLVWSRSSVPGCALEPWRHYIDVGFSYLSRWRLNAIQRWTTLFAINSPLKIGSW
jgi:hypothetical protein